MLRIESVQNSRVKQLKKLRTKKGRDKEQLFLIEGFHLVEEALKQHGIVQEIWIEEEKKFNLPLSRETIPMIEVTKKVMNAISMVEKPQGIIAICKIIKKNFEIEQGKTYVLVDKVQDPGNIGTIVRTADARGLDGVILNEGTVDIYNDKVIRSTQGSLFHLPIVYLPLDRVMIELKQCGIPVYGTSLLNGVNYQQIEKQDAFALIVGNEGNGVSEELLRLTTKNLYIPIYGQAESLNVAVATGILLYSL